MRDPYEAIGVCLDNRLSLDDKTEVVGLTIMQGTAFNIDLRLLPNMFWNSLKVYDRERGVKHMELVIKFAISFN